MKFPKLKALGRAVVGLFDPPGPSAPPKSSVIDFGGRAIADRRLARAIDGPHPWNGGMPTPQPRPTVEAMSAEVSRILDGLDLNQAESEEEANAMIRAALAHLPVRVGGLIGPDDPRYAGLVAQAERADRGTPDLADITDERPDTMAWATWKGMADAMRTPGWTFCRFGFRSSAEQAGQVMGIVKGPFGIFHRGWPACEHDTPDHRLYAITHLPSGIGMTHLFLTLPAAVAAAEIAMKLTGVDWDGMDFTDPTTWGDSQDRVGNAWAAAGLTDAPFHAHHYMTGAAMGVLMMTHASTTQGKPEKLS